MIVKASFSAHTDDVTLGLLFYRDQLVFFLLAELNFLPPLTLLPCKDWLTEWDHKDFEQHCSFPSIFSLHFL